MLAGLGLVSCSAAPTSDPRDTQPIPDGARFVERCSFMGDFACWLTSALSADAERERRPACIAFVEPNGTKVEQCGSRPGSQP